MRKREYNIEMDVMDTVQQDVDWIHLAKDKILCA